MYYDKWWKNHGHHIENACETKKTVDQKAMANALGVVNIGGIFVVLLCGLAFAVMVAIVEFCWSSHISKSSDLISTREEEERKKNRGRRKKDGQGTHSPPHYSEFIPLKYASVFCKCFVFFFNPGTSLCSELFQTLAPYLYDIRSTSEDDGSHTHRHHATSLAGGGHRRSTRPLGGGGIGGVSTVGASDCYSCDLVRDSNTDL